MKAAPAVYRPQPAAQMKSQAGCAPPVYRPAAIGGLQRMRQGRPADCLLSSAPPVYRPAHTQVAALLPFNSSAIQRQETEKEKQARRKKERESREQSRQTRQVNAANTYQTPHKNTEVQQGRLHEATKIKKNLGHISADSNKKQNSNTGKNLALINAAPKMSKPSSSTSEKPYYSQQSSTPKQKLDLRDELKNAMNRSASGDRKLFIDKFLNYCRMDPKLKTYEEKHQGWAESAWEKWQLKNMPAPLSEHPGMSMGRPKDQDDDSNDSGGGSMRHSGHNLIPQELTV
jgi:hypothetical protein